MKLIIPYSSFKVHDKEKQFFIFFTYVVLSFWQMFVFLKNLFGKFVKPELLCVPPTDILSIDYKDNSNYLPGNVNLQ